MSRLFLVMSLVIALGVSAARADQFDLYTNPVLAKAVEDGKHLNEVKELTFRQLGEHGGVLPGSNAAFVIVYTNDRRYCKLFAAPARQRVGVDKQFPMMLVEKYVTFKEGTDRAIKASGQNVHLYAGSRFHLDLGQVVPEAIGGDLLVVQSNQDPLSVIVKPIDKARMFVLTEAIPDVAPKKEAKLVIGEQFEVRYFNGTYKLQSDGRRSGSLTLKVDEAGDVTGSFYSDRDGRKYDVEGKAGNPRHAITFTIKYPQSKEQFTGFMFTGDGKAIAGTSKLQDHEAAFYALRTDE